MGGCPYRCEVAYGQDMPASFQQPDRRDTVAELVKESSKVGGRAGVGLGGVGESSDLGAVAGTEMPQGMVPAPHPQPQD